jgi:hypothetical protein
LGGIVLYVKEMSLSLFNFDIRYLGFDIRYCSPDFQFFIFRSLRYIVPQSGRPVVPLFIFLMD